MPVAKVHLIRVPHHLPVLFFMALAVLYSGSARGGIVQSLQGGGNFHSYVDVVNRWQDDARLDVLVMIEVTNSDLGYDEEDRGFIGRLRVEVEIEGPDGQVVGEKRQYHTPPLSHSEMSSTTLFQNIGLVIEDIPFRHGRFRCRVYDVNRRKEGVINEMKKRSMSSECSADWFAPESPRLATGVALGDPLFLFQAPLEQWNPSHTRSKGGGWLHDYMHPSRRYGIEQDHLQVFLPVWPPVGGVRSGTSSEGLMVQIVSLDMAYGINDTIQFDERGISTLEAGMPAGLFYTLDVNLLPEGSYRLSVAPLGGQGRAVVSGFDVIWRLEALGRHREMVMAEGHLVFEGKELEAFKGASPAEQQKMLEDFWFEHNPDPENPVNEAYLEFRYRMSYVQQFLGGFHSTGPADDRGLVFILLGPADEVQSEKLPMNFRDLNDARIKVYQRFAPDRESAWSKGSSTGGSQNKDPYDVVGGIPMPYSHRAQTQAQAMASSPSASFGFELWKYDTLGKPLFENRFSRSSMGTRFLFVDRNGTGDFFLESSNVVQGEE